MALVMPVEFSKSTAFRNFERGMRKNAEATRENYKWCIRSYMKWAGLSNPDKLLQGDNVTIEDKIMNYVDHATKTEKLASGSIRMKLSALKLFYEMNRRPLSWVLIEKTVEETNPKKDRAYTRQEIEKILSVADIRIRAMILLLISSGVRLGALPRLKVGSLKPVEEHRIFLVKVYEDTPDFYYSFCTPEARAAIEEYLSLRRKAGENVSDDSPLFRLEFDSQNSTQVADVKPVNEQAIKKTVQRITFVAGIRDRVSLKRKYSSETCSLAGKTRHEVKQVHGFRKYFVTTCKNAGMNHECREFMTGHDTRLDENYYDDENPESVKMMMLEYLKVVDQLSISEEKKLKEQVAKLKIENADLDVMKRGYLDMRLQLERKDDRVSQLEDMLGATNDTLLELKEEIERMKSKQA